MPNSIVFREKFANRAYGTSLGWAEAQAQDCAGLRLSPRRAAAASGRGGVLPLSRRGPQRLAVIEQRFHFRLAAAPATEPPIRSDVVRLSVRYPVHVHAGPGAIRTETSRDTTWTSPSEPCWADQQRVPVGEADLIAGRTRGQPGAGSDRPGRPGARGGRGRPRTTRRPPGPPWRPARTDSRRWPSNISVRHRRTAQRSGSRDEQDQPVVHKKLTNCDGTDDHRQEKQAIGPAIVLRASPRTKETSR